MSTQNGILNVINSAKLWTTPPAKEQYLPKYLKELCDEYQCQENARMVFPVQVSVSIRTLIQYTVSCGCNNLLMETK